MKLPKLEDQAFERIRKMGILEGNTRLAAKQGSELLLGPELHRERQQGDGKELVMCSSCKGLPGSI